MKRIFTVFSALALTACTAIEGSPKNTIKMGDSIQTPYAACGIYRQSKGVANPSVMDNLIAHNVLTPAQATRAMNADVHIGDSECLAYAAYGLQRSKITITKDVKGKVQSEQITYSCTNSDVPCPGLTVQFSNGKVTDITPNQ